MIEFNGENYYTIFEAREIIRKEEQQQWQLFHETQHAIWHAEGNLTAMGDDGCMDCGRSIEEQYALADEFGTVRADGTIVTMREARHDN